MSVYHEARDAHCMDERPDALQLDSWPQTWGVYSTRRKAELAEAFQPPGRFVWKVCETERGWELVFWPAHLGETFA